MNSVFPPQSPGRCAVHESMSNCRECGEMMVPSSRSIRVFSAEEHTTPLKVEARECPICGCRVPVDGAVEHALRMLDAPAAMAC